MTNVVWKEKNLSLINIQELHNALVSCNVCFFDGSFSGLGVDYEV